MEVLDNKAVLDQLEQLGKADPLGQQEPMDLQDNKDFRVPGVIKGALVSLAHLDQQVSRVL